MQYYVNHATDVTSLGKVSLGDALCAAGLLFKIFENTQIISSTQTSQYILKKEPSVQTKFTAHMSNLLCPAKLNKTESETILGRTITLISKYCTSFLLVGKS